MNEEAISGLVVLFALGAGAQWLAWRTSVPSILVLLLVGFVAGPVTGLIVPDELLGPLAFPLVSLGAAVVLFEGGLSTRWQDIRRVATPVRRLVTLGLLLTWSSITAAAYFWLDLGFELSTLLGAVLVVTGPTVIGPLLRHARPHGQVGRILKYEGIVNDPVGALLAVLVYQVIVAEELETAVSLVALGVLRASVLASAIGVAAGALYVVLRRREWLPEHLDNAVLLPLALGVYALANSVQHESGLLAVTVFGIGVASQRTVNVEGNLEFAEHARTLIISVLFVLLTARMRLSDLADLPSGIVAFLAALVFAVRPLTVAVATLGTDLSWRERAFLAAMAPRGIVAAAVSSVFAMRLLDQGHERATLLMPVTFLVIAACVAVYGLGARPLVKLFDLEQRSPSGVLVLGANRVARELATCLEGLGLRVILVDSDRSRVQRARQLGLDVHRGRLLSEHVLNRLDLDDVGHFVALTPDDDANTLAVTHFRSPFGDDCVHQVAVDPRADHSPESYASELRGMPFAKGVTYDDLTDLVRHGATARVARVGDDARAASDDREGSSHPRLFVWSTSGRLRGWPAKSLAPDDRVVVLGPPDGRSDRCA